jgi:hypothetical protein
MATLIVVVPDRPYGIVAGSGVVCAALGGTSGGRTTVYYEGNLFGAENIKSYADRIWHAADRLLRQYPTSAMLALPTDHLVVLGTFDTETGQVTLDGDRERGILGDWLGVEAVPDSELVSTDHTHTEARLRRDGKLTDCPACNPRPAEAGQIPAGGVCPWCGHVEPADDTEPAQPGFRVELDGEYGAETGAIRLLDGDEELVMWDMTEWAEDPSLALVIANAIRIGFTEGPDGIRARLIAGHPRDLGGEQ